MEKIIQEDDILKVKEMMSSNVMSVDPETSVIDIAKIMKDNNIGSVPVVKDNKVIGIVTDRDIVLRDTALAKDNKTLKAKDVMSHGITIASSEMDIHDAADLMAEKQIRRLPVVENDKLVGMLALGDLAVRPVLEDNAGEALNEISKPTHTLY
jgi:CBS domain-containing protein